MNEQEREMDLALAECEQENRLLRARNERLEQELTLLKEIIDSYTRASNPSLFKPRLEKNT